MDFLAEAFVYLAAAVVAVPLARRFGLGAVLGYLIAGVAIGPFGFGFLGRAGADVMHTAEFGVVVMLFVVGLELDARTLWRRRGALLGSGGMQVVATALLFAACGLAFGVAWRPALAAGLILAMSSTAIVLQSLQEKGWLSSSGGQRAFLVLLFQDVAVIPLLAVLPLLAVAGGDAAPAAAGADAHAGALAHWPGWARGLATIGAVAGVVALGRWLVTPAFRVVARARLRETFTAAALLLVVGIALLMQLVGLSPALGTFVAGVVLATSEYRHELEADLEPFKGLLLGLFFLGVGASIDFALVGERAGVVAALVAVLVVGKFAVLWWLGGRARLATDQRLLFALSLAQGGEFCFVLLAFAAQNAVLATADANLLTAVVALSMATTPLLLVWYERVLRRRVGTPEAAPPKAADAVHGDAPVLIVGFGHFGSTIGRLLRARGVPTTVLDQDSDRVDLLRRMGFEVYYGDASRLELLTAAGAGRAAAVLLCLGDVERTRAIAALLRRHFPGVRVLVRAEARYEAYELLGDGVEDVYREALDTSLRMGMDALRLVGVPAHEALRSVQAFRRRDESDLRRLAQQWRSDAYVDAARQSIEELERALVQDLERNERGGDRAWDADSLRRDFGGGLPPTRDVGA